MQLTGEKCYKKGLLWGVTIFDVSKEIKTFKDALDWLNTMNDLAKDTDKTSKKDDMGMKLLRSLIGQKKLVEKDFDTIQKLLGLIVKMNKIKQGSKKAWFGRTKQPGFQNSLECAAYKVRGHIADIVNNFAIRQSGSFGVGFKEFYHFFLQELCNSFSSDIDSILDETKVLDKLCTKLKNALSGYIKQHSDSMNMDVDDFKRVCKWVKSTIKDFLGEKISSAFIEFLPGILKKEVIQEFLDFGSKNGGNNGGNVENKINTLDRFIEYIKAKRKHLNLSGFDFHNVTWTIA